MRQWTDEERKKKAELIQQWRPWEKSSGAKTAKGKAKSRANATKHGAYGEEMAEMQRTLALCRKLLRKTREAKVT